jgi:hypothetical protein
MTALITVNHSKDSQMPHSAPSVFVRETSLVALTRENPLAAFAAELDPLAKDQYALSMYSDPCGSRVRIAADLDLRGAKRLAKRLQWRIKRLEMEEGEGSAGSSHLALRSTRSAD